jgi:hypothetical protein
MRRNRQHAGRLGLAILGFAISGVLTLAPLALGQSSSAPPAGIPYDWSHHHVIFSRPATTEQAQRIEKDPRYWMQRYRNEFPILLPAKRSSEVASGSGSATHVSSRRGSKTQGGDWQENMGSGASIGAENYPAKFSFSLSTANCGTAAQPDFVVYSSGLEGSSTQASLVAYDNLYSGCTGTVPSTYWAYNTGGQILTSPAYSGDGTQVAFVQTDIGLEAGLVLVKWAASTTESAGNPATLTPVSPSAYASCRIRPCMTIILPTDSSGNPADNTTSSIFYDYADDVAWVGDNHGWLHKFAPLFKGTPAEIRTGGWPVQVNPRNPTALGDPVFDSASGNVFVGDAGGYLYLVTPTGGVTQSGQLDFGTGIGTGVFVDSTTGVVYVFSSSDGTGACAGGANCAAVFTLSNTFTGGSTGTAVQVGTSTVSGTTPNPLYLGAFDNAYENSVNGTGNLYVCGNTGANPVLYRIPVTAGVLGTPAALVALTVAARTPACSPVTDLLNPNASPGPSEKLFFGVQNYGHAALCAAKGCAMSFVDLPWQASTPYKVGQEILVLRTANNTFYVNVVTGAGTSAAIPPAAWPNAVGATTANGTVTFMNQGPATVNALGSWAAAHAYALRTRILDSNNNVQIVSVAGTSGSPNPPAWSTTAGGVTLDGTVTWVNGGVWPNGALPAAGGTSGFIVDNTVETLPGASQVYFSTLGNQTCTTSGTKGGCAVQASQSALK